MELPLIHKNKVKYCNVNDLSVRQINNILYFSDYTLKKIRRRFYNSHPIPLKALVKLTNLMNIHLSILLYLNTHVKNTKSIPIL